MAVSSRRYAAGGKQYAASVLAACWLLLTAVGHPRAADLAPTAHPRLPDDPARYWLVPATTTSAPSTLASFARGVQLFNDGKYAAALPLVSDRALASTSLANYARYYTGFSQLRLERYDEAEKTLRSLDDEKLVGYLAEAVALRLSELELLKKNG